MFQTPTTAPKHTSTRTAARRRRTIATAAALVGLAAAASACGGAAPSDTADTDFADLGLTADIAPAADTDTPADIADVTDSAVATTGTDTVIAPNNDTQPVDAAAPTPNPSPIAPNTNTNTDHDTGTDNETDTNTDHDTDTDADNGTSNDTDNDTDADEPGKTPIDPFGPGAAQIEVSAPELSIAQACYANDDTLTWMAASDNEMRLEVLHGERLSAMRATNSPSPLITTRQDNGGAILTNAFNLQSDENSRIQLSWKIVGSLGDVDLYWESSTPVAGSQASEAFRSPSNPACFVKVGFVMTTDGTPPIDPGTPPTGPNRPDLTDAVDQPTEAKLPDPPQADMEVAVRNVKIEASPECFANGLDSRFFHTTNAPVAVVLDTNGISPTALTTMAHDDTELTNELRELSISDGALRAFANRDLGYAVTVQVQGAVTGGIVFSWFETATAPGTYTSPVFNGPTNDCDISINFLVIELD